MRVIVSMNLPIIPTLAEDTVRMVRHGLADILEALGEPVGPRPGEVTHAYRAGETLIVSPDMYDRILESVDTKAPWPT